MTPKNIAFDSQKMSLKSAFKFTRGHVDVQVYEVVDEFEEQLKLR